MLGLIVTIARTIFPLDVRAEPGSTLGEGNLIWAVEEGKEKFPAARLVDHDAI